MTIKSSVSTRVIFPELHAYFILCHFNVVETEYGLFYSGNFTLI